MQILHGSIRICTLLKSTPTFTGPVVSLVEGAVHGAHQIFLAIFPFVVFLLKRWCFEKYHLFLLFFTRIKKIVPFKIKRGAGICIHQSLSLTGVCKCTQRYQLAGRAKAARRQRCHPYC